VYSREIDENDLLQSKRGTVVLERNNCRQRHWFARFKRKSLVVSKSLHMIDHGSFCAISRQRMQRRYCIIRNRSQGVEKI
jgi:IS1 family transposase